MPLGLFLWKKSGREIDSLSLSFSRFSFFPERDAGLTSWAIISISSSPASYLTEHLATLEPQNPSINEFYVVQKRRSPDFEAL